MLGKLAEWITLKLFNSLSEAQKNTYESNGKDYKNLLNRIKFLMIAILLIIVLLPIAYIFEIEKELVVGSLVFLFMRYWNNGHHFKSVDVCFWVTLSTLLLVQVSNYFLNEYILIFTAFNFVSNLIFAPFRKQKSKSKFYNRKIVSLLICIAGYFLGSIVVAAIFIQSIDLIHNIKNKKTDGA